MRWPVLYEVNDCSLSITLFLLIYILFFTSNSEHFQIHFRRDFAIELSMIPWSHFSAKMELTLCITALLLFLVNFYLQLLRFSAQRRKRLFRGAGRHDLRMRCSFQDNGQRYKLYFASNNFLGWIMSSHGISVMRHNNSCGKTLLDNWVEEVR